MQKVSEANVKAAEDDFLPKVFLSTTGSYSSGGLSVTALPGTGGQAQTVNLANNQFGATVILGMTIPIYDGGTRDAVLGQARADVDKAKAILDRTRNDAVRQIVVAQNALSTSISAHEASTALEAVAQTTFDAALAAYRQGVGSATDVTVAESAMLQARNSATDFYSTALSAAASPAFSSGALGK